MEMARARVRLDGMLQAYVDRSTLAEEHRYQEHRAVLLIQSAWRRRAVYKLLRRWDRAATEIQRLYRGHLGRERFFSFRRCKDTALRIAYFNHKATLIQKCFRGFYSRKYIHSYIARKEFLQGAMARGSDLKQKLYSYFHELWDQKLENAARKTKEDIDRFLESHHYFLSTQVMPGFYFSRYLEVLGDPNIIEEKIKEARKHRDSIRDVKFLKQRPRPGPLWRSKYYITSVGQYCTRYDVRRQEEREAKLMQTHDEDFKLYHKPKRTTDVEPGITIRISSPYPERQKDPQLWRKISNKRFIVSVPRRRRFSCGG